MSVPSGESPGSDGTPPGRARLTDFSRRAAKWIAAVLVVSLVLPAVTKQWTDNQQQRQLKSQVTTRLATAAARATTDGGFLLGNQIQFRRTQADVLGGYQDALATWKSEASAIEAQLRGYFAKTRNTSDDALVRAMQGYSGLVQAYIAYCMFYNDLGDRQLFLGNFDAGLRALRAATDGEPRGDVVPMLVARSENEELGGRRLPILGFNKQAQNLWADEIVQASVPIIRMTNERQARGFQVGVGAFLRQIFYPFE
jgi:hypothetical protein